MTRGNKISDTAVRGLENAERASVWRRLGAQVSVLIGPIAIGVIFQTRLHSQTLSSTLSSSSSLDNSRRITRISLHIGYCCAAPLFSLLVLVIGSHDFEDHFHRKLDVRSDGDKHTLHASFDV
jgi:hypothetical protein